MYYAVIAGYKLHGLYRSKAAAIKLKDELSEAVVWWQEPVVVPINPNHETEEDFPSEAIHCTHRLMDAIDNKWFGRERIKP